MTKRNPDLVSASEIASYAFCPEAWRLGEGLGLEASNDAELAEGKRLHIETARIEERSTTALGAGVMLIVLGVLALVAYLVFHAGR